MNAEFWSQVGFGIVATAFAWWAYTLWTTLNAERAAHHQHVADLTERLLNWSEIVRTALDQNTDALKGLRDGFNIYESLEEMRQFTRKFKSSQSERET